MKQFLNTLKQFISGFFVCHKLFCQHYIILQQKEKKTSYVQLYISSSKYDALGQPLLNLSSQLKWFRLPVPSSRTQFPVINYISILFSLKIKQKEYYIL